MSGIEQWNSVLKLNALFAADVNSLIVPAMLKQGSIHKLVHISSISAYSLRGSAPYAASKAFLNAYVTTLGRELATTNICVSAIMPGAFVTPGGTWEEYTMKNPEIVDDFLRHHHASKRLGIPIEILPAIDFLSDPSNSFSQGCIVNIDGGTM